MDYTKFGRFVAGFVLCFGVWPAVGQTVSPQRFPQRPTAEEQATLLDEVRDYAINYTQKLPDFVCLEQISRYVQTTGTDEWRMADLLTAQLTYFEQKEEYKLVSQNGRAVAGMSYASVGGAFSTGDFGTHMREIFDTDTHATFKWTRWTTLRNRGTHVFSYRVPLESSKYTVEYGGEQTGQRHNMQQVKVSYRGLVFVDDELRTIVRITREPLNMPPSFPIKLIEETVDYDFVKIGDRQFFVPIEAELEMHSRAEVTKNVKQFRLYQKFSSDVQIKFNGQALPLVPDDRIKEHPPQPQL